MAIFHKKLHAKFDHVYFSTFDYYFGFVGAISLVITNPSRIITSRLDLFDLQSIYMQAVDGCLSGLSVLWVTKVADDINMTVD